MYLYISHNVFNPHVLFDGIHKKRSKSSENFSAWKQRAGYAFVLIPFLVKSHGGWTRVDCLLSAFSLFFIDAILMAF